jgi:type IV pilus assembly protein PilE
MKSVKGFTVVEVVVGLAMAGILAAVAIPSYLEYSKRGRRADAVAGLTQLQLAQERWRGNNANYTADLAALGVGTRSPAGHYTLAVTSATANGFIATATATSAAVTQDTRCTTLRLVVAAGNIRYASADGNAVDDDSGANRCWGR